MKILIVEDNSSVRRLIHLALSTKAREIVESTDGAEALEAYQRHMPDLVLMDIRMPVTDGLTATKQIMREFPKARVVMLTDYDDDEMRAASYTAGACGYILKVDLNELDCYVGGLDQC